MKSISTFIGELICSAALLASCSGNEQVMDPQSFEDLRGLTVSLLEGSAQSDYASAHLQDMDITFVYFPGTSDCVMSVAQGKSDVYFGTNLQIYNDEFRRQNMRISHYVDEIYAPFAFGVKKGNATLLEDLNACIDSLQASGALDEARERWFDVNNTDFHDCVVIPPVDSDPAGGKTLLRVGIQGVKQPTEVLLGNQWTGFEIEILQRFATLHDMELQVNVFDYHNLIPALNSGVIDIISSTLIINDERKQKVDFTHPTHEMKTALIVKGSGKENVSLGQKIKESAYASLVREDRWKLIADGLWVSVLITLLSMIFGSLLAVLVCALGYSRKGWVRATGQVYIYVMRNIPMLVFLMLMFYVFLAKSGLSPITVAVIAFSMNSAAFISEIYRTGIESIDRGQFEAGMGLGGTKLQTFFYIIAPQAVKKVIPVYKNQCVSLLKSTSIVGYISIIDLTKASDLIRSASFEAFFPLIIVTLVYFALATLIVISLDKLMKII